MTSEWHKSLQDDYRKLFVSKIEAHEDCVVCMPTCNEYAADYRGFGKTRLILELSNKYNLPIIAVTEAQAKHLKEEAYNLKFNNVRVLMLDNNMRDILRPGEIVLVDEGMEMLTCDCFAIDNNVHVVGFIWLLGGKRPHIHKIML